jgi:hypothetical protein
MEKTNFECAGTIHHLMVRLWTTAKLSSLGISSATCEIHNFRQITWQYACALVSSPVK